MTDHRPKLKRLIDEFLVSHGAPFFQLQRGLGLLDQNSLRAGRRAAVFIALTWGVPLILGLPSSVVPGASGTTPYILDLTVWARFFIAIGCFVLAEQQVENRLRVKLAQFVQAPLIAPSSMAAAALAVKIALRRRDSAIAETICLVAAIAFSIVRAVHLLGSDITGWAVSASPNGGHLTAAGWWSVVVSFPLFWFLLLRGLWRHLVWTLLLRRIARLELRLVATHPDRRGGLSFIADYPNAYATFVFGASSVVAATLAHSFMTQALTTATFGYVAAAWLAVVLALFAVPLAAFTKPLNRLKESTILNYGARATQYHRRAERKLLGGNVAASDPAEAEEGAEEDPSKQFDTSGKLSTILMSRAAVVPVGAAALVPFAVAGATKLPYKEVLAVVKKLVLL